MFMYMIAYNLHYVHSASYRQSYTYIVQVIGNHIHKHYFYMWAWIYILHFTFTSRSGK